MEYAFHVYNTLARAGIAAGLKRLLGELQDPPVILCVGSDLAVGDSLGPVTGTLIRREEGFGGYLYGTLATPVTAKEVKYLQSFLTDTHPRSKVIAVDAAVGEPSEIGLIKVSDRPLSPGAGANKRLQSVGDVSVLGILAKKSAFCYAQLDLVRLNTVYAMAEAIAEGIMRFAEPTNKMLKMGVRTSQI